MSFVGKPRFTPSKDGDLLGLIVKRLEKHRESVEKSMIQNPRSRSVMLQRRKTQ
jgi:hypothetical protein